MNQNRLGRLFPNASPAFLKANSDSNEVPLPSKPKDALKPPQVSEKPPSSVSFTIWGEPVGKPRQTQRDKWAKRPCVLRYRAWADKARASVPRGTILTIYHEIAFIAYLELPKSYSKKKRGELIGKPHMLKPDCDNILKSILDSLFKEDSLIWKIRGEKRWNDGGGARVLVALFE